MSIDTPADAGNPDARPHDRFVTITADDPADRPLPAMSNLDRRILAYLGKLPPTPIDPHALGRWPDLTAVVNGCSRDGDKQSDRELVRAALDRLAREGLVECFVQIRRGGGREWFALVKGVIVPDDTAPHVEAMS